MYRTSFPAKLERCMLKIGRGAQGSACVPRTGAGDKGDLGLRSLYNEEAREPPAQLRRFVSIHRSETRSCKFMLPGAFLHPLHPPNSYCCL